MAISGAALGGFAEGFGSGTRTALAGKEVRLREQKNAADIQGKQRKTAQTEFDAILKQGIDAAKTGKVDQVKTLYGSPQFQQQLNLLDFRLGLPEGTSLQKLNESISLTATPGDVAKTAGQSAIAKAREIVGAGNIPADKQGAAVNRQLGIEDPAEEARLKEQEKLLGRADVMKTILKQAKADPLSPSVETPFGDAGASEDAKSVARMFSGAQKLFAAGLTSEANSLVSQARFLAENSPDMQRAEELAKPISPELARELDVPLGTPLSALTEGQLGSLKTPEKKTEDTSAASAKGRGRVKAEQQLAFINEARTPVTNLLAQLETDPTLVGVGGSLRAKGQTALSVISDLGMESLFEEAKTVALEQTELGLDEAETLFNSPTLSVLDIIENSVGLALARMRTPDQRIPADVIKRSIKDVNLRGLTGSKQVINRLKFINDIFDRRADSLEKRFGISGTAPLEEETPEVTPKFTIDELKKIVGQ